MRAPTAAHGIRASAPYVHGSAPQQRTRGYDARTHLHARGQCGHAHNAHAGAPADWTAKLSVRSPSVPSPYQSGGQRRSRLEPFPLMPFPLSAVSARSRLEPFPRRPFPLAERTVALLAALANAMRYHCSARSPMSLCGHASASASGTTIRACVTTPDKRKSVCRSKTTCKPGNCICAGNININIYIHIQIHIHIHIHMCVHIYVRIYIHTYIHTYIHSYSYIRRLV